MTFMQGGLWGGRRIAVFTNQSIVENIYVKPHSPSFRLERGAHVGTIMDCFIYVGYGLVIVTKRKGYSCFFQQVRFI